MTSFSCTSSRCANLFVRRVLPVMAITLSAACGRFTDAMTGHTDVVARADGKELQVSDAVRLIAANPQVPAEADVVRALADLFIDYTLLATAVAEDTLLTAIDMSTFTDPLLDQALISQLRDQVIQADTIFDEAEITSRWTTDGPTAEVRARHILLRTPADATQAQRDSVRQAAEALRTRAAGGEDFAALATQFSQDPGSAERGGDLDFFGRGQMIAPFEEAAFSMQPGQISPVVETPYGYHVIRLEERRQQELGAERDQFRQFLVQQAIQEAEIAYLDSLSTNAKVEIREGGLAAVKEIAARPDVRLRGRAANREIASYEGGEFTAGEFARFIRSSSPEAQNAFSTAPDEQLEQGVKQLVQMELLVAEANERGLKVAPEQETQIRQQAQLTVRQLVEQTGFAQAARVSATETELQEQVMMILEGIVNGTAPFVPLGPLGVALREAYDYEVNEGSFEEVLTQVQQLRAQQPAQGIPQMPEGMTLDSTGMPVMPEGSAPVPQGAPAPGQPVAP